MKLTLAVCAVLGVLLVLLTGCGLQRAIPGPTTVVQHGAFDIAAGKHTSSGGFPNTSAIPSPRGR